MPKWSRRELVTTWVTDRSIGNWLGAGPGGPQSNRVTVTVTHSRGRNTSVNTQKTSTQMEQWSGRRHYLTQLEVRSSRSRSSSVKPVCQAKCQATVELLNNELKRLTKFSAIRWAPTGSHKSCRGWIFEFKERSNLILCLDRRNLIQLERWTDLTPMNQCHMASGTGTRTGVLGNSCICICVFVSAHSPFGSLCDVE